MKIWKYRVLIPYGVIGVLMLTGLIIGSIVDVPAVATWQVEASSAEREWPPDRILMRQIRALVERDPAEAAARVWLHEDPWLYGVRSGDGWIVPGIPSDSPVLTDQILPVRIISWTGGTAKCKRCAELNQIARQYAETYNLMTVQILVTN